MLSDVVFALILRGISQPCRAPTTHYRGHACHHIRPGVVRTSPKSMWRNRVLTTPLAGLPALPRALVLRVQHAVHRRPPEELPVRALLRAAVPLPALVQYRPTCLFAFFSGFLSLAASDSQPRLQARSALRALRRAGPLPVVPLSKNAVVWRVFIDQMRGRTVLCAFWILYSALCQQSVRK